MVKMFNSEYLTKYIEYSEPPVGQTKAWHAGVGLVAASALTNGGFYTFWGENVYTNLWLLLIGRSGSGKSTISKVGLELLIKARNRVSGKDVDILDYKEDENKLDMDSFVLPSDSTPEAFFKRLSVNPRGVIHWDDVAGTLEAFERSYMKGFAKFITKCYTVPLEEAKETVSGGLITVRKPCFSIYGSSTLEWYQDKLGNKREQAGGFSQRWFYMMQDVAAKFNSSPHPRPQYKEDELVRWLVKIREISIPEAEKEIKLTKEAEEMYSAYESSLDTAGEFYDFEKRIATGVLKTGMILAIAREAVKKSPKPFRVTADDIQDGITMASFWRKSLPEIFNIGDTLFKERKLQIFRLLKESKKGELSYGELLKALEIPLFEFQRTIDTLKITKEIVELESAVPGESIIKKEE
jgi:energy-coupling factor transporter ATP-binding protein EcfA2